MRREMLHGRKMEFKNTFFAIRNAKSLDRMIEVVGILRVRAIS
jgi:hypothetical protein